MEPVPEPLLRGARRALVRHGAAGATMERIAAEAGTSRMTLHRHRVTKDDLLRGLADALEREYRDAMWPALVGEGDAATRLREALARECDVAEANLALLGALSQLERGAVFHEPGDEVLTRSGFVEAVGRLLRDGAADGSLAAGADPDETATVLFNLVGHTYRHLRSGHGWTPARARDAVVRIALDGVAAR